MRSKNTLMGSTRGVANMADKSVTILIAVFVLLTLGTVFIPLLFTALDNFASVSPAGLSALFGSGGILAIILIIGFFTASMKLFKGIGGK